MYKWLAELKACHDPGALTRRAWLRALLAAWSGHFPRTILDAGCGDGRNAFLVKEYWPWATLVGVDASRDAVDKARRRAVVERSPRTRFVVAELDSFEPEPAFDLVLCVDVLEHIVADGAAIATMTAFLRENGVLIVHVPSVHQKHYFGVGDEDARFAGGESHGHVRAGYDPVALTALLTSAGLEVTTVQPTVGLTAGWLSDLDYLFTRTPLQPLRIITYAAATVAAKVEVRRPPVQGRGLLAIARRGGFRDRGRGRGSVRPGLAVGVPA